MTELCDSYGVPRKAGDKLINVSPDIFVTYVPGRSVFGLAI